MTNKTSEVAIKVSAILDHNNIFGFVMHDPIGNDPLGKITMKLKHTFKPPQGGIQTLLLDERDILNPESEFNYSFLNPRYLDNLELEVDFHYQSGVTTQKVTVLDADEDDVDLSLPSNPIREGGSVTQGNPQFDENVPFDPDPDDMIIEVEGIANEIFDLDMDEFDIPQSPVREDFGVYSEEATTNVIHNPELNSTTAGYLIDAPGFTQNLHYYANGGSGVLRATVTNTSLINAFSDVNLKSQLFSINCGNSYITLSTYYRQITEHMAEEAELFLEYYNNRKQLLSVVKKPFEAVRRQEYIREEATFTNIPSATAYVSWGVVFKNVTDTSPLTVEITKPQLEHNNRATTYTSNFRDFDVIRTNQIQWSPEFYMKLKTLFSSNGLRGLVDTTVSGKDGFRWMASNNQMQFRILDSAGSTVLNVMSDPILKELNDEIEYGISIEKQYIKFYVDGELHSEKQVSYPPFDFQGTAFVGRLEPSGAALNSKILDFGVYRSKP